ncbi:MULTISPECIES: type II secretion system protein [Corallincola]|nr:MULTISPECIES: type II secretion system protein [Corallincola]
MKQQRGFSLIELVIVVIILGILAVTALPKFLNITDEAEAANIEGIAGGFATGVSLVRAQWEAEGRPTADSENSIWYDGVRLYLTEEIVESVSPGYPIADVTGQTYDGIDETHCIQVWEGMLQNPPTVTGTLADLNDPNNKNAFRYFVEVSGGGVNHTCDFYLVTTMEQNAAGNYLNPTTGVGNNFQYFPATGRVTININN